MKLKLVSLMSVPTILVGTVPAITLTSCSKEKMKVIIDTDIGNDCDDIGALSILGNAYKKDLVDVVAVTVCNRYLPSIHTTDIMLEQYGIDCPIGKSDNDQEVHLWHNYAEAIDDKWEARCEKDPSRILSATKVLRRALANNSGEKIKLITLGMFNNIANLLNSGSDEISNKTGKELLEENVSEIISMGGRFDFVDPTYAEFNIKENITAAQTVVNDTVVPITFCGWEVGNPIRTGSEFFKHRDSVQFVAYHTYNDWALRESWDPLTMYVGLFGSWQNSKLGIAHVDDDGHTTFTEEESGKCKYVIVHNKPDEIAMQLESWMTVI